MSTFEKDDEPHTIRISTKPRAEGRLADERSSEHRAPQTEEIPLRRTHQTEEITLRRDPKTEEIAVGKDTAAPSDEPVDAGLDEQELFRGLRTMVPFFLEAEIEHDFKQSITLSCSDEPPPFVSGLWEEARSGGRVMLSEDLAASLHGLELPFCGLLGCYRPHEKTVVIYNQGVDWIMSLMERDFQRALPHSLSSRPLRDLHVQDAKKYTAAMHSYLRWLVVTLTMIHELGHAMVHLSLCEDYPWSTSAGFDQLPLSTQEHLAQGIVVTALSIKELTAPFPTSDLAAVFHRLALGQSAECRRWAKAMPWQDVNEIAPVLAALRSGTIQRSLLVF